MTNRRDTSDGRLANGQTSTSKVLFDVHAVLDRINRVLPVRHRYVLTRRNTVRLRYVVLPGGSLAGLALVAAAMVSPVFVPAAESMPAYDIAQDFVQDGPVILGPAPDDQMLATRKRLKRSSDDLGTAERLAMMDPAAGQPDPVVAHTGLPLPSAKPVIDGLVAALSPDPTPGEKTVKIGSGDTLTGVLTRAGLNSTEAYQVVQAIKSHVDPRALKPGQVMNIKFDPAEDGIRFAGLNMAVDALRTVSVARGMAEDGYKVDLHEKQLKKSIYIQETQVQSSLFGSAAKAGIPKAVVAEAIRVYSWDIDFQRDVRQGDKLQVMYEQYETEDGVKIKTGEMIYAKLTLGDEDVPIYRYKMKDGRIDYFQPNGRSIRKTLMKTPVDGARMSSGFGMRRHPIQGYNKMHKGVDFAAPTGTPIYAAGDGVIDKSGRVNGYGNYVRLRHNSQLKTAYAHMSRIAKGMTPGARVRQGDIIGYVGSTGNSTGPHLHYEVLVNNVQVNPRGVNLPTGEILEGEQLRVFQAHARQIDRDFSTSSRNMKLAQNASAAASASTAKN